MLNQITEQFVRQTVFVGPLGIAEDPIERLWVGFFNFTHRPLECFADVGCLLANVVPVASLGNLKAVVLREQGVLLIAVGLIEGAANFLVVND